MDEHHLGGRGTDAGGDRVLSSLPAGNDLPRVVVEPRALGQLVPARRRGHHDDPPDGTRRGNGFDRALQHAAPVDELVQLVPAAHALARTGGHDHRVGEGLDLSHVPMVPQARAWRTALRAGREKSTSTEVARRPSVRRPFGARGSRSRRARVAGSCRRPPPRSSCRRRDTRRPGRAPCPAARP